MKGEHNLMLSSISKKGLAVAILLVVVCMIPLVKAKETAMSYWTSPTLANLFSVYMVNASDGWAVGGNGAIIHWDGTEWMNFPSPTNSSLISISMVNADDGWAMGFDWLHWNGTSWNEFPGAVAIPNINSVYMVDSNNGWAVGALGSIWHWDGTQWNEVESSPMYVFFAVFMNSANDGWAVGEWGTLVPPNASTVALHWNGTQWTDVGGPTKSPLNSVYMVGPNDGWAVGNGGTIIRWNGVQWIPEYSETIQIMLVLSSMLIVVILTKTVLKSDVRRRIKRHNVPVTIEFPPYASSS